MAPPSFAAARMAATCGMGLNNAMATGVNMLGDVHGGAGEQAIALFHHVLRIGPEDLAEALDSWRVEHGKYLPGFGHRFHTPTDPRAPRPLQLVDEGAETGAVPGAYAQIARANEQYLT